jgi:hypothetical protein
MTAPRGAVATDCADCGAIHHGASVSCEACGSLDIWPVDVVDCRAGETGCRDSYHRPGTGLHVQDAAG